jgi:hypothetical protein
MKCPSCGQQPLSMLQSLTAFTRGVSFPQAIKGYLKCRHCGALLRVVGFKPFFWIYFSLLFAIFFGFWALLPRIISHFGYTFPLEILIVWLLFVVFGSTYVLRKSARLEKTSQTVAPSPLQENK